MKLRKYQDIFISTELDDIIPFTITGCIKTLIMEGEILYCPKVSQLSTDLLVFDKGTLFNFEETMIGLKL